MLHIHPFLGPIKTEPRPPASATADPDIPAKIILAATLTCANLHVNAPQDIE